MNASGAQYLVIGGYAVNYYGYSRATADMDIWIAINPENASRVAATVREFGFSTAETQSFLERGRVIRMGEPPIRIEVLTSISGVEFASCFERRVESELDGVAVNLIHLDDLKCNKAASGRLKDLLDLEQLG